MPVGQSKRKSIGNTEIAFRTENNTRDLDKGPHYSKLIVKAMKMNTLSKGKQETAENWTQNNWWAGKRTETSKPYMPEKTNTTFTIFKRSNSIVLHSFGYSGWFHHKELNCWKPYRRSKYVIKMVLKIISYNKCRSGCREKGTLVHCRWEHKMCSRCGNQCGASSK